MYVIWHTGAATSPSPQWRLSPLPALRSTLSNLIIRGFETPPDSAASLLAGQLFCTAWSVRICLDNDTLLERSTINEGEDDECSIGDGVLPPPRFRFFDIILSRGSGLVRWESPLVSSQRAEAFVLAMTEVTDGGEKRVYKVDPIDAQVAISDAVSAAVSESDESLTAPHVGAQIRAYSRAANTLHAQRQRVAAGGEPWSRTEQLAKLAMLRTASEGILSKKVRGIVEFSPEETAILDAVAAGDAAMAADGEDCE